MKSSRPPMRLCWFCRLYIIGLIFFVWLPTSVQAEDFAFTVTADMRSSHSVFENVCQSIINDAGGPGAFHITVGDEDGRIWENRTVIDTYFGTSAIWYPIIGNHEEEDGVEMEWLRNEYDSGNGLRTPLSNLTNHDGPVGTVRTNYSWDYGNVHFIALNQYWNGGTTEGSGNSTSGSDTATDGDIVPELRNWLAANLSAHKIKPFVFVFGHEPAFPYNRHVGDSLDLYPANRDALWSLLESERVQVFFVGHTHYYSKHQGDKNNVGQVWQLDAGNAGNDPGDGKTYFDVEVTGEQAMVHVYRDGGTGTFGLTETIVLDSRYQMDIGAEGFDTGYLDGAEIGTHSDWFYGAGSPQTVSGIGVNGTWGLTNGVQPFAWAAREFNWNEPTVVGVIAQMDFQTDASGHFNDDLVGWTISNTDSGSSNIFGVQLGPGGSGASGYNIEAYWDGDSFGDGGGRTSIANLPALSVSAWYRLRVEITKLSNTSAKIDAQLWSLDAGGNADTVLASGGIEDTDLLPNTPGDEIPNPGYFTATRMWPVYKNSDIIAGAADNASFEVMEDFSCAGDFDTDGDVDGDDLSERALGNETLDIGTFAAAFGRADCL